MAKPKLRFPEFTNDWEQRKLLEFGQATGGTSIESEFSEDGIYKVISIGSYSEDSVYRDQGIRAVRSDKTANRILNKGDITMILNDKTASGNIIGRVLLIEESGVYVYNQRTERIEVDSSNYDSQFIYTMLNAPEIRNKIIKQSQGNTQIYVNWTTVSQTDYLVPQLSEQRRIGECFSNLDNLIALQQREVEALEKQKKAVMQKIFSQQIRFKKDDGTDYPRWEERALGELFDYERPDAYIVNSTEYKDKYPIPVLTANQAFILGYTNETSGIYKGEPVILFDDFTCDIKFADFPFKVKSSAMKLLHVKDNIPSVFAYNLLKHIDYKPQAHARHWISIMQPIIVCIPCLEEQQKIADLLSDMDNAIDLAKQELEKWKLLKKGLLQQMFV